MKHYEKRVISTLLALSIIIISIFCFPLSVYASSSGVHPDPDKPFGNILVEGAKYAVFYILSQIGAVADGDFFNFMQNKATWNDYWNGDNITEITDNTGNVVSYNFSEELVAYIKQCLDEYAKENQPFTVEKTYKMSQIPASSFGSKVAHDYFKSYFDSDSYKYIIFNAFSTSGRIADITPLIKEGGGFVKLGTFYVDLYDSEWTDCRVPTKSYTVKTDESGKSYLDIADSEGNYRYDVFCHYKDGRTEFGNNPSLATKDGGNIRVFNTASDFINYSVGQRKVYYTSNYYDYVPEDLTVSIDELQKTIDDMQDVIDKLLDQITNDTSESEIEELLRLILEELKNQQGGGGGSGGGGGDVNVDIDLSTTNSLLSKILAKVTQIFDKISETATGAVDAANTKLQETLDEILSTLKSIRRWTIADTVFDGLDALANIASFLKDFLTAPAAAISTAASSLGETANILTDKFPFSIPWDLAALVTLLSAEPQAPVFKLPIVIESYGIEEYMEIDMSQFEALSTIMCGMLSIIYTYGILSMTTKVMGID